MTLTFLLMAAGILGWFVVANLIARWWERREVMRLVEAAYVALTAASMLLYGQVVLLGIVLRGQ